MSPTTIGKLCLFFAASILILAGCETASDDTSSPAEEATTRSAATAQAGNEPRSYSTPGNGNTTSVPRRPAAAAPTRAPMRSAPATMGAGYNRPGFTANVVDGRLHVFRAGESGELGDKHITLIGAGPGGMTIKAADRDTALAYLASVSGFAVNIVDGRVLVWSGSQASEELSDKHVTRVGAGPLGSTVKAEDKETLDAYLAALAAAK